MLAVVMLVAIKSAKWDNVDSLETLLGFEEATYFAAFLWLAIAGPGAASLDRLLLRWSGDQPEARQLPDLRTSILPASDR
jgi:putative oxidoreductase